MSAEQRWEFRVRAEHPGHWERERGESSRVVMNVDRGLKSGRPDFVALTPEEAFTLAEALLHAANIVVHVKAKEDA